MTKLAPNTLQDIELELLQPSKTNPRKIFKPEELQDLATSIKEKGVLEPLLVRASPFGDMLEIVAGERRYRAAKLAKLKKVPCIIRDLTDQQVAEIQVVENMQRQDLSPLEEANGYELLHTKHGYDYEELAAKIGKSKSYIYHRLALLQLSPKVQQALAHGHLQLSWAEVFTRVKDHKDQDKLLSSCPDGKGSNYYPIDTLDELKSKVEADFLLRLAKAPFDTKDAKLVPAAGACANCPKRTGAQADIFGESGKTDTCQDQACWSEKVKVNKEQLLAKAKKGGSEVVTGTAAAKAIEAINQGWGQTAYIKPTKNCDVLKPGKAKTWSAVTGGKAKLITLLDEKTGATVKVYRRSEAISLIPKTQLDDYSKDQTPAAKAKAREAEIKKKKEAALQELQVQLAATAAVDKFEKLSDRAALELIAPYLSEMIESNSYGGSESGLEQVFKADANDLNKMVKKAKFKKPSELKRILGMLLLLDDSIEPASVCKDVGVDLKKYLAEAKKLQAEKEAVEQAKASKERKGSALAAGETLDDIEGDDDEGSNQ